MTEFKTNKMQALLPYLAVEADRAHECARLARASEGSAATNDRLQPRCEAKRSNVGWTPVLGGDDVKGYTGRNTDCLIITT